MRGVLPIQSYPIPESSTVGIAGSSRMDDAGVGGFASLGPQVVRGVRALHRGPPPARPTDRRLPGPALSDLRRGGSSCSLEAHCPSPRAPANQSRSKVVAAFEAFPEDDPLVLTDPLPSMVTVADVGVDEPEAEIDWVDEVQTEPVAPKEARPNVL